MSNWANKRPTLDSLPEKGYQDNDVAIALTSWVDAKMSAKADQLQNFYRQLDPSTCDANKLDYLAFLNGLSGSYWNTSWQESTKRTFIQYAHSELWQYRGTKRSLSFVLDTHQIKHRLWFDSSSLLPFTLPQVLGSYHLRFYIRLPISYVRDGWHWKEAQRTAKNFAPAIVGHQVCHEYFRLGFSKVGEPLFNDGTFK